MYPNLRAELARKNIKNEELRQFLDIPISSLYDKLRGTSEWKISECKKIADGLFNGMSIEYLFATEPIDEVK